MSKSDKRWPERAVAAYAGEREIVPGEELEIRWLFQAGRRVPAFVARLHLGDLVWAKIGNYRRRARVVKVERGVQITGTYTEVRLRFTEGDAR